LNNKRIYLRFVSNVGNDTKPLYILLFERFSKKLIVYYENYEL
jgi:hypothetical protein